ncbi:MAG: hypothetical protein ACJ8GN_09230 [Longimicrobiaceae bacterium]
MSFISRLFGGDNPKQRLAAAAQLAQAGRLDESAESWLAAVERKPLLVLDEAQLAALGPVLPRVARRLLDGLTRAPDRGKPWKLERRGSFDGEERWRLEQERHGTMRELLPALRYLALLIAHTSGAPGRLRIDCDRPNPDSEAYLPIEQVGEAIITWDEACRITDVKVKA